ncbi:epimerase [Phycicoccus sp. Root563]|uniref:TIGR01777 family oxidoreductase n=1 Tax=unclassified Phycicoccus TaxID=2637926 RepID=UPI000702EDE1|nr:MULTISPECIES: TIGR01777 family oxidoreductase [unclassified Phycicoccus]KQU70374.1 epimerase [Phycicoccus sp. Root101]KQZ88667.1 epimerase [Phycicoccus sp. Root563]
MPQRVAVTGSTGLIGSALSAFLRERGDEVVRLVRRAPEQPDEVRWDPAARLLDPAALSGVTAVVHLAGAGVGDHRWTPSYQQQILGSRVDGTTTIATALADLGEPVRLVSGSAVGVYGDRGDEVLTEDSPLGGGFLSEVVRAWEAAADPARDAGLSVAHPRTGIVLSPEGGALSRMLPLARLGINGPLGNGRQWWPWISLRDTVAGLAHLVDHPEVEGPVNLVAPTPDRQIDIARALGRQIHRPAIFPAPAFGIKLVLGGFSDEILTSKRVVAQRLTASGFTHRDPDIASALRWVLAQQS